MKSTWFNRETRSQQLDEKVIQSRTATFGDARMKVEQKVGAVMRHFDRVAPRYDFMNNVCSLGIQMTWKRAAIRWLAPPPAARILDVCGGTADLAILALRAAGVGARATVYDRNRTMMTGGAQKVGAAGLAHRIDFVQGDAESISFPDNHFDVAMVGFGIRNLTHMRRGFAEMVRVLKPGGKLLCLEFSKPVNPLFRSLYDFHSFHVMPLLGQLLAGNRQGYVCLPETIRRFPLPNELANILRIAGLQQVNWQRMTNGIAVAHWGVKRGRSLSV